MDNALPRMTHLPNDELRTAETYATRAYVAAADRLADALSFQRLAASVGENGAPWTTDVHAARLLADRALAAAVAIHDVCVDLRVSL